MITVYGDKKPESFPQNFVPANLQELFIRQLFNESRFVPDAVSPAGARGIAQIMPITERDLKARFGFDDSFDPLDPIQARAGQEKLMNHLLDASWNKGSDENKYIKALAAYNYGSGNVLKVLNRLKDEGVDIYNDTSWVENLPEETNKYVNNILYGGPEAYEREFTNRMPLYNEIYNAEQEKPQAAAPKPQRQVSEELQNAFKILKRDAPKYQEGGLYASGVTGPTITPAGALSRIGTVINPEGMGFDGSVSFEDRIQPYDPNKSIYDRDPAGLPSQFDAFYRDFSPVGDIQVLLESVAAAKDGDYAIASLGPLLMVLPQAVGNRVKVAVKKLQEAKKINKAAVREGEVIKALGEINQVGDEVMKFRQTNPQALDQAMRESVEGMSRSGADLQILPFGALSPDDLAVDALAANRQRALGYYGTDPLAEAVVPATTGRILGGPPISAVDRRGMQLVEGTPSDRAVQNALIHQRHGSQSGTGLLGSQEMQRLVADIELNRVPVPGTKFQVLRDGKIKPIKASDIREGDVITSLSQQASAGAMGTNRLVSTSGRDLRSLYDMFGEEVSGALTAAEVSFFESPKFKALPQAKQTKLSELYEGIADPDIATQFDDMAYGVGLGSESKGLIGDIKPSFEESLEMGSLDLEEGIPDSWMPDMSKYQSGGPGTAIQIPTPPAVEKVMDPRNPAFKIVNTKGIPVTRADTFRPGGRKDIGSPYVAEDEFGLSSKQAFKVLRTGLEEQGVPFMMLRPDMRPSLKYEKGGKVRCKKKRAPGMQVKKYYDGGIYGDPPYTAAADVTSVSMPDLQLLSILQSLPDTRPTGPTIGPATPIDEDRYNREKRRQEAIARGINPNLAFTMPPGIMADSQASAEYQYDNMLSSPIGQVATGMAFTPIDIGIEAALPLLPSTYAGRQLNRLGQRVGSQVERGVEAIEGMGAKPAFGTSGFATPEKIGEGYRMSKEVYDRRMKEYLSSEGQERMRNKIADDLTEMLINARRQPVIDSKGRQAIQRLEGAVINGRVNPNSPLVAQELQYANAQIQASKFNLQSPSNPSGVGLSESDLMAMDAEYMALTQSTKKNDVRYNKLINEVEQAERAGQWDLAKRKSKELDALEPLMKEEGIRKRNLLNTMNQETGGLLIQDAFHSPMDNAITIGGGNLLDPTNASRVTAHEFQHLLQRPGALVSDPASRLPKSLLGQGRRNFGIRPEGILKVERDLGELMKYKNPGSNLSDLRYFDTAGQRGDILERSAFVSELRESMVQKGAIENSYDLITPDMIGDFVTNQTKKGDLRIVDLFDFKKPEVKKIVADAMNKLPVVAVGAGAAANQDFKYGGKMKIKKKKKSGFRTI